MNEQLTLQQTQQNILALNTPGVPFSYSASGATITGTWDIDANAQGLINSDSYKQHYVITVTLDEATRTYSYNEATSTDAAHQEILSASRSHSQFSGKMVEKHFGMADLLSANKSTADAAKYTVSFDNTQLKKPLFAALEQAGWHKKVGFFGRLFGKK